MKIFRIKLFAVICIIYGVMYFGLCNAVTKDGDVVLVPLLFIGFVSSVMVTIVVPVIKEWRK
jgi:hypothetical protein